MNAGAMAQRGWQWVSTRAIRIGSNIATAFVQIWANKGRSYTHVQEGGYQRWNPDLKSPDTILVSVEEINKDIKELERAQLRNARPSSLIRSRAGRSPAVPRNAFRSDRAYSSALSPPRPWSAWYWGSSFSPPPWIFRTSQLSSRFRGDPSFRWTRSTMTSLSKT